MLRIFYIIYIKNTKFIYKSYIRYYCLMSNRVQIGVGLNQNEYRDFSRIAELEKRSDANLARVAILFFIEWTKDRYAKEGRKL